MHLIAGSDHLFNWNILWLPKNFLFYLVLNHFYSVSRKLFPFSNDQSIYYIENWHRKLLRTKLILNILNSILFSHLQIIFLPMLIFKIDTVSPCFKFLKSCWSHATSGNHWIHQKRVLAIWNVHVYVHIVDHSRVRVGKNFLMSRLSLINDSINYEWLNLSKDTYKIKCKENILSWNAVFKLNWIQITMKCKWIFLKSKFYLQWNKFS